MEAALPGAIQEAQPAAGISKAQALGLAEGLEAMQARHAREVRQHLERYLGKALPLPAGVPEHVHVEARDAIEIDSEHVSEVCSPTSLHDPTPSWEDTPGPRAAAQQEDRPSDVRRENLSTFSGFSSTMIPQVPQIQSTKQSESYQDRKKTFLKRLVSNFWYEISSSLLILANAFMIAWESESNARAVQEGHFEGRATVFIVLMNLFCIIFVVDLVIRVVAFKRKFLFNRHGHFTKEARWNLYDTFCIMAYVIEVIAEAATAHRGGWKNSALLRVIRLARALRVLHVLRVVTVFRELRIMVSSLTDALVPLIWFCVIVLLVLMSLGVVLTNAVVDHFARSDASYYSRDEIAANLADDSNQGLLYYYGSLSSAVASLFMSITGGVDWEEALEPLGRLSSFHKFLFYLFIAFAVFAMINVGNAIFLDAVIQRSKNDREFVIEETAQEKKIFMKMMDNLFSELDLDNSNHVSLAELKRYLDKSDVATFLRALNLDVQQVGYLFRLMDSDESGTIDRVEFREGCHKLRGDAKKLDLAIMQQEVKWIRGCLERLCEAPGGPQPAGLQRRNKPPECLRLGTTTTAWC